MQLPATIAGAALSPTMTALALNGVMAPTTPYGSGNPYAIAVRELRVRVALDLVGHSGVVADQPDAGVDVAEGLTAKVAHIRDLEVGELLATLFDEVGPPEHHRAAHVRRYLPPRLLVRRLAS